MKLKNKKTGEIVEKWPDNFVVNSGSQIYNYSSLADLCEEWSDYEEEIKKYWFVSPIDIDVVETEEMKGDEVDEFNKEIGNYFSSKEEAELAVRKLQAWKRLKDKGFEFCGYDALGCGEIHFISDWNIDDEYNKEQRKEDLTTLFGGGK